MANAHIYAAGGKFPLPLRSILDIVRRWENPSYDEVLGTTGPSISVTPRRPHWCTEILFRAWDMYSASQLDIKCDETSPKPAKCSGYFSAPYDPPGSFEGRQRALYFHATYNNYECCFISLQMSLHETIRH